MNKLLLIISLLNICFLGKAQTCPTEKDSLQSKVVFVLKGADQSQLNAIKTEFEKYPQIIKATYVYTSLNYLLVDLNMSMNNPNFVRYAELIKIMCGAITHDKILIKIPSSYNEIANVNDVYTFILK